MKNPIIILACLALVVACSNQMDQKVIEVEGLASIKVDPDIVKVNIESTAQDMVYSSAVTKVNQNSDRIINILKSNGFTNLKSVNFSVNKVRDYRDDADKGYLASQSLALEFPVEKEAINKAINLLSDKNISSEFNFSFDLSDKKRIEAENKLVSEAVKNATARMELLAQTGNIFTGKILKVNYHGKEQFFQPTDGLFFKSEEAAKPEYQFSGLNISQINLSDNVSVTWEIK